MVEGARVVAATSSRVHRCRVTYPIATRSACCPLQARDNTHNRAECAAAATRHGPNMPTNPAPRSVDRRRRLLPRDYVTQPDRFGVDGDVEFAMPPGGDDASFEIARLVHRLAVVARTSGRCGAQLGRRFQFSRQVFSDVLNGRRWPNASTLAALLIHALEQTHGRPSPVIHATAPAAAGRGRERHARDRDR